MHLHPSLFIGLMSGTSLDGVDGVIADFSPDSGGRLHVQTLAAAYRPFSEDLRKQAMALQAPGEDEIHREALAASALSKLYAETVAALLKDAGIRARQVRAIGAHGQTVRHRPDCGYTRQIGNPALLAELTGIDVVADFRSRDIAAGGQGAPLVPAFHQALFGHPEEVRIIANIGGMANISVLDRNLTVAGFDTGPGNVLLDAWCIRHRGTTYDANGSWAATGAIIPALLKDLLSEPFLSLPPPKSTGRDLFDAAWLDGKLQPYASLDVADVQTTLAAFTATSLADSVVRYAPHASIIYVAGGGAYNPTLLELLQAMLLQRGSAASVTTTDALGVPPNQVEALAFAWLARQHVERKSANLPQVTGATGPRILGALYPA